MPVDLSGDWQLVKSEGFEEYLRSIGAPEAKIKVAVDAKPPLVIKQSGDKDFTVTSGLIMETQTYAIGTPFNTTLEGRNVTTVASWDGSKLVLTSTSKEEIYAEKEHVITREMVDGKLVQKACVVGGPVATRTFEKA